MHGEDCLFRLSMPSILSSEAPSVFNPYLAIDIPESFGHVMPPRTAILAMLFNCVHGDTQCKRYPSHADSLTNSV